MSEPIPFTRSVGDCVASTLVALFAGTFVASVMLALGMALFRPNGVDDRWWTAPAFAFVLMLPALLFTAPVTFLFGLPAYAWLRARRQANVATVLGVVLFAAGVAAFATNASLARVVALYGTCIGLLTHVWQRRRDRRG